MPTAKKTIAQKPRARKKKPPGRNKWHIVFVFLGLFLSVTLAIWHYREGLAYYFSFKSDHKLKDQGAVSALHSGQVLSRYSENAVGFDVSEYQGRIDWGNLGKAEDKFALSYVFIRATAGKDRVDSRFKENWDGAKQKKLLRGAYHYYRPDENSVEQAANFILTVPLRKGDLPPVLDIEKIPANQSVERLKVGLHRWLDAVEEHYGVKPIIYTGEKYYDAFLKEEFEEYTFWIANYNFFIEKFGDGWMLWQFTENGRIPGIKGKVDLNVFNGGMSRLEYLELE